MIVRLTDKSPFCTIGPHSFSMGQPQLDVDTAELTSEQIAQLVYNLRRGVLATNEDYSKLIDRPIVVPNPGPAITHEAVSERVTLTQEKKDWDNEQKELNKLLRKPISTIKKETRSFSLGRLRRLVELEKETKNRKSLLSFITDQVNMLTAQAQAAVGSKDVGGSFQSDPQAVSTQVTDIVESEEETVTLPQEVLNQLGD